MEALHRRVLDLLGFADVLVDAENGGIALCRNGDFYAAIRYDALPKKLWALAPSLRDLREALEIGLSDAGCYSIEIAYNRAEQFKKEGWGAWLEDLTGGSNDIHTPQRYETPTLAVAALFVAACEAGLIEGKKVVLQ